MNGQAQLALPPFTRWVKRLIILHTVGYVTWLILARWSGQAAVAGEMVLLPGSVWDGKVWQLVSYLVSNETPFNFLLSMLMLWMFGGSLEIRWGTRRFLGTYFILGSGSALLLSLLALAVDRLATMPVAGPEAIVMGLTVAWGITYAEQRVYFFGLFPLKGKHLILVILGGMLLYALATHPLAFVIHAIAAGLAALLVWGWWRPRQLLASIRGAWLRWRARRARRHLRSVGDDDDQRYLH